MYIVHQLILGSSLKGIRHDQCCVGEVKDSISTNPRVNTKELFRESFFVE